MAIPFEQPEAPLEGGTYTPDPRPIPDHIRDIVAAMPPCLQQKVGMFIWLLQEEVAPDGDALVEIVEGAIAAIGAYTRSR